MTVINKKFTPPALPLAPIEYEQRQQDQFQYALRLYLNLLDKYLTDLTNLLNTGETFENITASTITTGTLTADSANISDLTGTYTNMGAVGTLAMQADGLIVNTAVVKSLMANNFYGGTFYGDGRNLQLPYNQIISNSDQTAAALDQAYAVTYDSTDFPDGISVVSNSRITFAKQGIYLLTYSIQFENDNPTTETIDIWLRYEGTDAANTNSRFSMPPRKSVGVPSTLIAVTPIMVDIEADGDYIEIMWHPSDLGVTLESYPAVSYSAGVTPAIPATPSVILTVQHISSQFPPIQRVAPVATVGFTELGTVIVSTNQT